MTVKLCWKHEKQVKSKKFPSVEHIIQLMSNCLWSGEWIEDAKGERIEVDWNTICHENLTLF